MTKFLVTAYEHRTGRAIPAARTDWFADNDGRVLETYVNRAADRGWAAGVSRGRFEPTAPVKRQQMAAFLTRFLDSLVEEGTARTP